MAKDPTSLTLLEQQILQATRKQHPSAYGVSIAEAIEGATGKRQQVGPIYTALGRMLKDGLVRSRDGEATAERGGRKKTYFELTGLGRSALIKSEQAHDALREGFAEGATA